MEICGGAGDLIISGVLTCSVFSHGTACSGVASAFGFVNSVAMNNVGSKSTIPAVLGHHWLGT